MSRAIFLLPLVLVSACGPAATDTTNNNQRDPAITAALADPILTDPELDGRANRDVLRPADEPLRAMVPPGAPSALRGSAPPTVLARATPAMVAMPAFATCDRTVRYSYGWAAALPVDLNLPAEAEVAEAAGSDAKGCALRLVAWSALLSPETVLENYRRTAKASGYGLTEASAANATVLTGTRRDGAAFIATVAADDGGSSVDLVTNRGR